MGTARHMTEPQKWSREWRIRDTPFTGWLLEKAEAAGWDPSDPEMKATLRLTAAMIRTGSGSELDLDRLAAALSVTTDEIKAASAEELTANQQAEAVFERPDMAELDERLDGIGY